MEQVKEQMVVELTIERAGFLSSGAWRPAASWIPAVALAPVKRVAGGLRFDVASPWLLPRTGHAVRCLMASRRHADARCGLARSAGRLGGLETAAAATVRR